MRHWHGYGHGYGHGLSGWGIAVMTIGSLLILALLVLLAVALFRYVSRSRQPLAHGAAGAAGAAAGPGWRHGWTGGPGGPGGALHGPAPEQVLAERFARGEIDEEEYRRRLDVLRSAGGPGNWPGNGPNGPGDS
ncbi:SHOCT domain-containing protein [Streptomyces sp. NRRL WC-3742]|uniref:SHOCT domain-containing protein n=1 Tax=Streptomyces sp. NRRL WC-3742 TaxID=1463934 RepID=UPI00056333E0|nr:SHOCT domain-containing protein [Streptomyces sp. NRRL WC-3742]